MVKRQSALDCEYVEGSYPFNSKINISFKECSNLHLTQLACWPNTLNSAEDFFRKELNINISPNFNRGIVEKNFSLWRIEPFKWWILEKELNLPENLGTNLDMSYAFTSIRIYGDKATLLLNRHLPLDLRDKIFPDNSSASSAIHHVSVKLLKFSSNNFYLLIPRGFALSIWEMLLESSRQFGYEILPK